MINGYERASKEIVPAVRMVIARELKIKYNMTEERIAGILGIAQAAVSKYVNGNYSELVGDTAEKIDMESINKYIEGIAKGNQEDLKKCVCTVCGKMNSFECRFSSSEAQVSKVSKKR